MKQKRLKSIACTLLLAALCLPACNNDNEGLLPDGKYPVTFTARIGELTIVRSTADLNQWAGGEKVAIQITDEVKKYAAASDGTLSIAEGDPFFWQKLPETKNVSAWYPYNDSKPTTFAVQTDQSESGYAASDFLYAKPQDITYIKDGSSPLTFKHLPTKVIIHLKYDKEFTADEIENATVSIVGQATTSETIEDNGSVPQTTSGAESITPNKRTSIPADFSQSVQALLVPQQMQNKDFIKVTVKGNDFYYTPTKENDANLGSGKQYTYKITVKKTGLEVSVDTPVSWKEGAATSGAVAEATLFNVTCPSGNGVDDFEIENATPQSGDKYTVIPNQTIIISYKTTLKRSCYNLEQGIAKVSTPIYENGKITITVSDIRGDLVFSFDEYGFAEVGDYYYADGTWSPDYVPDGSAACIGVVFKVGAGTGDAARNYGDKLSKGIRGYVVALTDATQDICEWGERDINTPLENVTSANNADYNGFKNTETIIKVYRNTNKWHYYDAFQAIIDYRSAVVAPQSSSDWYLPSLKQLADIYSLYQNNPNYILYGRLQSISDDNLFREAPEMTIHTGTKGRGGYWTSTEMKNSDAWFIRFTDGSREAFGKGQDWHKDSYVRAILTF